MTDFRWVANGINRSFGTVTYDNEADYVIVGAGSAGCVLANRITESSDSTVSISYLQRNQQSVFG